MFDGFMTDRHALCMAVLKIGIRDMGKRNMAFADPETSNSIVLGRCINETQMMIIIFIKFLKLSSLIKYAKP